MAWVTTISTHTKVWCVSYCNSSDDEPTVTIFNNEEAANKYYTWCIEDMAYEKVAMDYTPIMCRFIK